MVATCFNGMEFSIGLSDGDFKIVTVLNILKQYLTTFGIKLVIIQLRYRPILRLNSVPPSESFDDLWCLLGQLALILRLDKGMIKLKHYLKAYVLFMVFLCSSAGATSCRLPDQLSVDFDQQNDTEISSFSRSELGYTAEFVGGISRASTASNDESDFQWVILPFGESSEGFSNGEALINLNPPAEFLEMRFNSENDSVARMQMLDSGQGVIRERAIDVGERQLLIESVSVGEPLIATVKIIIDGGTQEISLSQFNYYDSDGIYICKGDGYGGVIGGLWWVIVLLVWSLIARIRL